MTEIIESASETFASGDIEKIREILCAPEPTDPFEEIDLDDPEFDEDAEWEFIRSWLEGETKNSDDTRKRG